MNRIGLATPSWNTEEWIYPFLKLSDGLLDRRVIVQGKEPLKSYVQEHNTSTEPDRSEALIRKEFPDVEIIYQEKAEFGPHFWQQGHDYLKGDCDFILRFDSDEMLTREEWVKLVEFLREVDDLDALAINFGKSILHSHGFNSGVKNPNDPWIETRGLHSRHNYQGFGYFIGAQHLYDVVVHHFTGLKRQNNKDISLPSDHYISVPEEIKELFIEGWEKLEQL